MNSSPNSALDASVLVLNKLFMAVHVISVRRAFCLLFKELAEVVSLEDGQFATYNFATWCEVSEYRAQYYRQEDDDWVRTVSTEIQAPRVIRLTGYEKIPKHTVKFNRRNIYARDLHARDTLLLAAYPNRPIYLLRPASAAPSAMPAFFPVSKDSLTAAWSSESITQNVTKSKIELTGPNTYMKCRMNFMSHAAGRASVSGSTRSVGITS